MKFIRTYFFLFAILLTFTLTGCELIGDIFEAGMWTALILIVLVVLLVTWIFRKLRGPRGPRL